MKATSTAGPTSATDGVYLFFALACAITWTMASGAALVLLTAPVGNGTSVKCAPAEATPAV